MKKELDFTQAVAPFPNKRYNIIYADPPWKYRVTNKSTRAAEAYYSTLKDSIIYNLSVDDIAAENCILFLWSTFPKLAEALETIKQWGFEYVTVAFTWIKQNKKSDSFFIGLGNWTRANAEICLLAKKGRPKRESKSVRQLVVSPVQEHSKKPDEVRDRIVELCGDLPRIELFARQKTPGWDVWGNEV